MKTRCLMVFILFVGGISLVLLLVGGARLTAAQSGLTATSTQTVLGAGADTFEMQGSSSAVTAANTEGTNSSIYSRFSADGDAHEPDDTCEQAQSIIADGSVRIHTFHDYADEDWSSFQTVSGTIYIIDARVPPSSTAGVVMELYSLALTATEMQIPPSSTADVVMELRSTCPGTGTFRQDHAFSKSITSHLSRINNGDARIVFRAFRDGPFFLRVLNQDPLVYGSHVEYYLSVRVLGDAPVGALVLVAGRFRTDDPLQRNIHNVTNVTYNLFRTRGYPPERVCYLATDLTLDADNDGQPDVNTMPSDANLEYAITQWAVDKVGSDRFLILYLMSSGGGYDKFYLDGVAGEEMTPKELDGWLDQLEAAVPGVKVNVIVEASHAGSFTGPPQTVSQAERVVIASTSAQGLAYASQDGVVFSDAFLDALGPCVSLWTAFEEAQAVVQSAHPDQTPWLDDDGDGVANEAEDGQEASRRFLFHVTRVAISGPATGTVQIGYTFIATVSPIIATLPITYVWQATNQSPATHTGGGLSDTISFTWNAPGTQTITVTASNAEGTVNASHHITIAESVSDDAYEPDDTCAQASALATNGTVQQHTFHQYADEDWAHFTVVSGTTYVLQAASTSPGADLELELHGACGQPPLPPDDEDTFGHDARLIFTAPSSGTYYVKALNYDPAVHGPDVTYELSVRAQSPAPIVVIVAGRNERDQLQDNIIFMGDQAYRAFRHAGVPRENIRYLSVGADHDADQDEHLDIDDLPTRDNVRYAVRDWPGERGLNSGKPFYLYLVDHGGTDYYCAMGCKSGSWVRAEDLDGWLSDLEASTGVDEVNVIIEACYSGSFIDGPAEVSSSGRVVIASTGSRRRAFPSQRGGYFSDAFFTALGDNADLWTAYVAGRTAAQAAWSEQTPWLDDNGDAVADGSDGQVARGRGLVAEGGGAVPVVDWLKMTEVSESGVATITAQIRDDVAVLTATVEIYRPGLTVPDTGEGETPVLPVYRLALRDDDDGVYEGVYTGFVEEGLYRLVAYAWDNDGNLSLPCETTVGETKVYLPLVLATHTPSPDGDAYEADDTCAQASPLETNGTVQQHTFHQYADGDWAHFTVAANAAYVLQATSTSPGADLVLELYDACGGDLEGFDDNAFGADARLVFTAPSSGTYYARALNHDPAVYGLDVTYELSVRQSFGGVALIVAGHDDNHNLQDNILHCTNTAFRTFLLGGLPKTNLRYLSDVNDDAHTDADGDGVSDVYADSSSANVRDAIINWAASLADANTLFYLYLMDHGAIDTFFTDGRDDTIAPDELDDWLTALEDATGASVNVIYEACHSGSFIDELSRPDRERVIIASTSSLKNAYPSRHGALFSDAFFTQLRQCSDLYTSFQAAKQAVKATRLWQIPCLDDNGDGVPNSGDGDLARQRGLNCGFDHSPVIDRVTPPGSIVDGDGVLRAQVQDDSGIEVDVWAVVYPPDFEEPAPTEDGTIPELGLPIVLLSDSDGDGEYIGVYEDFTEDGAYHVVVYAQDAGGNQALPVVMTVRTKWWVYLPLVLR